MSEKKWMGNYYNLGILGIASILLLTGCTWTTKYPVIAAQFLGRIYYLSNPMGNGNELVALVNKSSDYLTSDGTMIKFAEDLGTRLIAQALNAFSRTDYNDAYGSVLAMGGTMEQARGVANDIQGGAVDMFMMGKELLWLAQVLPPATNGNWGPYNTTGTEWRSSIRQILPIYQMMMATDPAMAQMVNSVMAQFGPLAEYYVVMLADMVGILENESQ